MAKRKVVGLCALCRKPRQIRHSHIVSKFVWKQSGVTGGRNRFDLISSTHPNTSRFNQQDGIREYLCCEGCEGKMSKWEDKAMRVWFGESSPFRHPQPDQAGYLFDHLPYREMKLFLMATLWRMGAIRMKDEPKSPFYCAVNLGADEPQLRRLLMAEDPAEPWRYGCNLSILTHKGMLLSYYMSQPGQFSGDNSPDQKFFCMVAAGLFMLWVVGTKTPPQHLQTMYLPKRGSLWVPVEEISSYPPLWAEFQNAAKVNGWTI